MKSTNTLVTFSFMGRDVSRTLYIDKAGDRLVRQAGEVWLLHPIENKILHPLTSNNLDTLYKIRDFIDTHMHHLEKAPQDIIYRVRLNIRILENYLEKKDKFFEKFYPVDHYDMHDFLKYAKRTWMEYIEREEFVNNG